MTGLFFLSFLASSCDVRLQHLRDLSGFFQATVQDWTEQAASRRQSGTSGPSLPRHTSRQGVPPAPTALGLRKAQGEGGRCFKKVQEMDEA